MPNEIERILIGLASQMMNALVSTRTTLLVVASQPGLILDQAQKQQLTDSILEGNIQIQAAMETLSFLPPLLNE